MDTMEKMILSRDFNYESPYFYNNDLALRCELGVGNDTKEYLLNAKKRAAEIFNILFGRSVNMFFFDDDIYDWDFDMEETVDIHNIISMQERRLKFSLEYQKKFDHKVIRDLPFDKDDSNCIRRNRICCYANEKLNPIDIINTQIENQDSPIIHFVSFDNRCILSVYDDRGCDIVFYDKSKFVKFYPLLRKYFLEYDKDLMEQRLNKN